MKKLFYIGSISSFFLLSLTLYKIYIPVKLVSPGVSKHSLAFKKYTGVDILPRSKIENGSNAPLLQKETDFKIIEINKGMSLKKIAETLKREHIIRDELAFEILARLKGLEKKIQAGNYKLSPSMNILQILSKLKKGESEKCCFTIPEGYNIMQIANLLERKGFITSKEKFIELCEQARMLQLNDSTCSMKACFQLRENSYKFQIQNPKSKIYNLKSTNSHHSNIPTFQHSSHPITDYKSNPPSSPFNKGGIQGGLLPITSFEGFLFPETYCISKGTSEKEIIELMVSQFNKSVDKKHITRRAKELGLSFYKILILASIIERESAVREEKPLISAVFHNRLKAGIPLQSCATVIYALGENFSGNLKKEDLEIDSPYNTYKVISLPPTPICSPGLESIKSALYPAEVDYLYFVSMNNGRHKFSSTLEEHNTAVFQYQLW